MIDTSGFGFTPWCLYSPHRSFAYKIERGKNTARQSLESRDETTHVLLPPSTLAPDVLLVYRHDCTGTLSATSFLSRQAFLSRGVSYTRDPAEGSDVI